MNAIWERKDSGDNVFQSARKTAPRRRAQPELADFLVKDEDVKGEDEVEEEEHMGWVGEEELAPILDGELEELGEQEHDDNAYVVRKGKQDVKHIHADNYHTTTVGAKKEKESHVGSYSKRQGVKKHTTPTSMKGLTVKEMRKQLKMVGIQTKSYQRRQQLIEAYIEAFGVPEDDAVKQQESKKSTPAARGPSFSSSSSPAQSLTPPPPPPRLGSGNALKDIIKLPLAFIRLVVWALLAPIRLALAVLNSTMKATQSLISSTKQGFSSSGVAGVGSILIFLVAFLCAQRVYRYVSHPAFLKYCDTGKYASQSKTLCIPCPDNGYCQMGEFTHCQPWYEKKSSKCRPIWVLRELKPFIIQTIEEAQARRECSGTSTPPGLNPSQIATKLEEQYGEAVRSKGLDLRDLRTRQDKVLREIVSDPKTGIKNRGNLYTSSMGYRRYSWRCYILNKCVWPLLSFALANWKYVAPAMGVASIYLRKLWHRWTIARLTARIREELEQSVSDGPFGSKQYMPVPVEHLKSIMGYQSNPQVMEDALDNLKERYGMISESEEQINGVQRQCLQWYAPSPNQSPNHYPILSRLGSSFRFS